MGWYLLWGDGDEDRKGWKSTINLSEGKNDEDVDDDDDDDDDECIFDEELPRAKDE
jgi:hypothetical protein